MCIGQPFAAATALAHVPRTQWFDSANQATKINKIVAIRVSEDELDPSTTLIRRSRWTFFQILENRAGGGKFDLVFFLHCCRHFHFA